MKKEDYMISGISLEKIRNRFEGVVINLMKELIPQYPEFDNCQICIEDVYALSLSRIPSMYVRNDDLVFDDEKEIDENIEEIVKYAFFQVISEPKH